MPRTDNPTWTRDELILALDVYLRFPTAGKTHPAVLELSDLLQRVGPKSEAKDPVKFRNTNGAYMKLMNFKGVDPRVATKGLAKGGNQEAVILEEFLNSPEAFAVEVARIKTRAADGTASRGTRYWALVANPRQFRIMDAMAARDTEWWTTGGHDLRKGDRALIWKAKGNEKDRGLVALAEVLSDPVVTTWDVPEWLDGSGATPTLRVRIRYVKASGLPSWIGGPDDELLRNLSVFRATGGGVFRVTPEQWEAILEAVGRLGPVANWDVRLGSEMSREERRQRFGGALYGGIEPSAQSPHVFIYSDPSRGSRYGYNFDGWNDDGSAFLYTGEGRIGDQRLIGGNAAILRHKEDGRSLRVFVAAGAVGGGSSARRQLYIGEFAVDDQEPYFRAEAPDEAGDLRTVLVFRLRPVGDVLHRLEDLSTTGDLPGTAIVEAVDPTVAAEAVALEALNVLTFETSGSGSTTARRREAELADRYQRHLESQGHSVRRWRLQLPGAARPLWTDLFDETTHELYEVKANATRESIRQALGQLLDYRRHVPADAVAVLVPVRPNDDLVDLLHGVGISCVYEQGSSNFVRLDAP